MAGVVDGNGEPLLRVVAGMQGSANDIPMLQAEFTLTHIFDGPDREQLIIDWRVSRRTPARDRTRVIA